MKIMIDCYELIKGYGKSIGIYNYTKNLLDHLIPRLIDKHEVIIITNIKNNEDFKYKNVKNIIIDILPTNILSKIIWEMITVSYYIKKNDIELYFSPRGFLPRFPLKCKMVTTIHDLIPLYYKENYYDEINKLENFYIVSRLKKSCERADKILTISNFSKNEIVNKFNIDYSKIDVVYNGINFNKQVKKPKKYNDSKYIFAISSSTLKHKNLDAIINSYYVYFKRSSNPLKLKLCGVKNIEEYTSKITRECLNNIELLPFISDEELNWYYANANVFLFLSKIEGFGFPPLEALKFSTNVICSNIECFKEIIKDKAIFVDSDNYEEVAMKLVEFEGEKKKANNYFKEIKEKYNWNSASLKIERIFDYFN